MKSFTNTVYPVHIVCLNVINVSMWKIPLETQAKFFLYFCKEKNFIILQDVTDSELQNYWNVWQSNYNEI